MEFFNIFKENQFCLHFFERKEKHNFFKGENQSEASMKRNLMEWPAFLLVGYCIVSIVTLRAHVTLRRLPDFFKFYITATAKDSQAHF